MIVIGGSSSHDLARDLAAHLDSKYVEASTTRFPDGECYTRIDEELDDDVVIVQNSYPDHNLVELLLLQDAADNRGARSITCVIPYFGYARQDRVFKPGEPESARVMVRHLELGCDRVFTVDIHKEAVLRWFDRVAAVDLRAARAIGEHFSDRGIDIVLSPDIGAAGRAEEVAEVIGVPHDHLEKTRISGTEVRIAPSSVDVKGRRVLIVDDIISTGGTIVAATRELRSLGAAEVHVACTHGVFANGALDKLRGVDSVLCCNTIENEVSGISVAGIVAEAIRGDAE